MGKLRPYKYPAAKSGSELLLNSNLQTLYIETSYVALFYLIHLRIFLGHAQAPCYTIFLLLETIESL